jgi:RNA polymerase sigma-70 factor (ECF subfamily)
LETPTLSPIPSPSIERWPRTVAEFESLVDRYQHELVRFAFCRLRNRADAEDAVQDVLLRTYLARERHRDDVPVGPYLYRMVANRCTDLLRQRRRAESGVEEVSATAPCPDTSIGRLNEIEAVLSRLPSRQAEVMRLRIFSNLPFQSIAEAVGASLPTIKSRFRYGVRRLRDILSN